METMGIPKGLAAKLVKVMAKAEMVKKTGRNDFQKYDYATEADVLKEVRSTLVEQNVFIFSSVEGSHKEGDLTTVRVKNTFVDADTGESYSVLSLGQGSDKGDKGSNKAITAASKYFFLKNFLLPTGDDSEATDVEGKATKPKLASVTTVANAEPATPTETKKPASFRPAKKAPAATDEF